MHMKIPLKLSRVLNETRGVWEYTNSSMVVDPPHTTGRGGGALPTHAKRDNSELLVVTGLSLRGILPP